MDFLDIFRNTKQPYCDWRISYSPVEQIKFNRLILEEDLLIFH